jgi:hypothetical protein
MIEKIAAGSREGIFVVAQTAPDICMPAIE